ncbi:MAG TPA: CotH kinase family protein [bacterium]|nr:CotH kinase family protein [bacterium]
MNCPKYLPCLALMALQFILFETGFPQSLKINEFLAANTTGITDEDGEANDWIEIYNPTDQAINLQGLSLTDDFSSPQKWIFPPVEAPAHGFLLIWASDKDRRVPTHLHTNFKLDKSGEEIGLYAPDGTALDKIVFGPQAANLSFGRYPDGEVWMPSLKPTPGKANQPVVPAPVFSQEQGFYPAAIDLALSTPVAGAVIRYTLDGSNPEAVSPAYASPLTISATTVVRAATFASASQRSAIVTRSYFINESLSLPVLSLVIDPDSLKDKKRGIYSNYDSSGANWERPAHLTFFDQFQSPGFDAESGVRIHGSASRDYPKKSFRVYFRTDYGVDRIEYPLFPDAGVPHYSRFVIHNGGEDVMFYPGRWELFKNMLVRELGKGTLQIAAAARPALLYLNGRIWGIYTLRERIDDDYLHDHYGLDKDQLDLLQGDTSVFMEVQYGDRDNWDEIYGHFKHHDLADSLEYARVCRMVDVDNFRDYMIVNSYSGNHDWPHNNYYMFRSRSGDTRWRWIIWDCDHAFANALPEDVSLNSIQWITRDHLMPELKLFGSADNTTLLWSTLMLRKLLENQEFKIGFISRYADLLNFNLSASRAAFLVDSLAALLRPDIGREITRWSGKADPQASMDWEANVAFVRDYVQRRPEYLRDDLVEKFGLGGKVTVRLEKPQGDGIYTLNAHQPPAYPWEGVYFRTIPIRLQAFPAPNYRLLRWSDAALPVGDSIAVALDQDLTVHPIFTKIHNHPPVITSWQPADSELYVNGYHVLEFAASVTDADHDSLAITWLLDGTVAGHDSTFRVYPAASTTGKVQLRVTDTDTTVSRSWVMHLLTGVKADAAEVTSFALQQNYPNPFNPRTEIAFSLPAAGHVRVQIMNLAGQKVRTLAEGVFARGWHRLTWDAHDDQGDPLPSGLYYYVMESGDFRAIKKLLYLK